MTPPTISGATRAMLAAVVLLSTGLAAASDRRSTCELLPESVVRSITGRTLHIDPNAPHAYKTGREVCTYSAAGARFTFSLTTLESERAARLEFARELTRTFGSSAAGQPLRGVGVEARFRAAGQPEDNTIIARYDTVVFVLTGSADQEALVALARSVVAQLERPDRKS